MFQVLISLFLYSKYMHLIRLNNVNDNLYSPPNNVKPYSTIHHQIVEHVKRNILTKVDTNVDSNFNIRRLTVSLGSSKLKYP